MKTYNIMDITIEYFLKIKAANWGLLDYNVFQTAMLHNIAVVWHCSEVSNIFDKDPLWEIHFTSCPEHIPTNMQSLSKILMKQNLYFLQFTFDIYIFVF